MKLRVAMAGGRFQPGTVQRGLVYREREVPVPTSFLINGAGGLAYVYKGPVGVV